MNTFGKSLAACDEGQPHAHGRRDGGIEQARSPRAQERRAGERRGGMHRACGSFDCGAPSAGAPPRTAAAAGNGRDARAASHGARSSGPLLRALRATLSPVGMLAVAAALAAAVAATGRLESLVHRQPAATRAQLDEWRAMVEQAAEPHALSKLRALARDGDADAQAALGIALIGSREAGLRDEGLRWLETAAQAAATASTAGTDDGGHRGSGRTNGTRAARLALGKAWLLGTGGVERDYPRALAMLRPLAEAGDPSAAYYVGLMYRSGYGTPADPAEAARWFELAARHDVPAAQFMLANAYRDGSGVRRDEARALALYRQAADRELPEAVQTLAIAYRNGELGLPRDADAFHAQWIEAAHALKHPSVAP
nr:tetratricopeptide repeat protein [Burkholderia singularis]